MKSGLGFQIVNWNKAALMALSIMYIRAPHWWRYILIERSFLHLRSTACTETHCGWAGIVVCLLTNGMAARKAV